MRTRNALATLLAPLVLGQALLAQEPGVDSPHWPGFRGWHARGVAEGVPAPTEWDVDSGKNVLWRTPVAGLAHSSPVLWGERVFVTTAVRLEGDAGSVLVRSDSGVTPGTQIALEAQSPVFVSHDAGLKEAR